MADQSLTSLILRAWRESTEHETKVRVLQADGLHSETEMLVVTTSTVVVHEAVDAWLESVTRDEPATREPEH